MAQPFKRCSECGKGKLSLDMSYCLICEPSGIINDKLEQLEHSLENGTINEGQYLDTCNMLKVEYTLTVPKPVVGGTYGTVVVR
jgi:RecJ-like exonuclease